MFKGIQKKDIISISLQFLTNFYILTSFKSNFIAFYKAKKPVQ